MVFKLNNKEVVRGPEPRSSRLGVGVGVGEPGYRVTRQVPSSFSTTVVLTIEQAGSWQMCVGL